MSSLLIRVGVRNVFFKIILLFFLSSLYCMSSCMSDSDPLVWYNPEKAATYVVHNRGWNAEIGNKYARLPDRARDSVRSEVWRLSRNSAGLTLVFKSSANKINIKYKVSGSIALPNMTAMAVSGVDLYCKKENCTELKIQGSFNIERNGTIDCEFHHTLESDSNKKELIFRLLLPLYNEVEWIEIGVPKGETFEWIPSDSSSPIVVYGTSIVQGASASHPAMAWTSILQRQLNTPLINLGFSGNGRLEKNVIQLMIELNPSLIILDCLPNLDKSEYIEQTEELVINAVCQIRKETDSPILLIEHIGFSCNKSDSTYYNRMLRVNKSSQQAFGKLKNLGILGIYYLSNSELSFPLNGWVDHIHPNDIGMVHLESVIERKVLQIFDREKLSN